MNCEGLLAERTKRMSSSAIREILKVVSQPGMTSLAGGLPSAESFPMHLMTGLTESVFRKYSSRVLQYDLTEGFMPLREVLVGHLGKMGIKTSADDINISSGSQGVLDAVGKVFISEGDKVAVEAPTYLGAIQAFNPYNPQYIRLDTDTDGLIPESLKNALKSHNIKLTYLVPTFQNPTGRTITLSRRKQIAEILIKYDALLVEDDPYSCLRFRGEDVPSIKTLAPENVLYLSTLSKVFAAGLRIGFYVADEFIRKWIVLAKQGTDLHTSTFNQALAAEYISCGHMETQIPKIISLYRPKIEAMLDALDKCMPDEFTWSKPEGGMFVWVEGPKGFDMENINIKCVQKKTAFVPGKYFFTQEGEGIETARLNFTMPNVETIQKSVKIFADVIKEELANRK